MKINILSGLPDCGMYKGRKQGKTLGLALGAVSEAILNPGKEVVLRDHYGTSGANRHMFDLTQVLVGNLGLIGISFKHQNLSLRFDLFQESEEYIEVNGSVYKKVDDL